MNTPEKHETAEHPRRTRPKMTPGKHAFTIHFPNKGHLHFKRSTIIAWGKPGTMAMANLTGTLSAPSTGTINGTLYQGRLFWVMVFTGLRQGYTYTLQMYDRGTAISEDMGGVLRGIYYAPTWGFTFDYPTESDIVGTNFVAYGSTIGSSTTPMNAALSPDPGGETITYLYGGNGITDWAFEFDGVADGDYQLQVSGGGDSGDPQTENISVRG